MKQRSLLLMQVTISTVAIIFGVGLLALADNASTGGSVTIIATVLPQRSIVVDSNFTILRIYSNTTEDVRPAVYLNTLDGEELTYTDSIRRQYQSIKHITNFSQPGVVYIRKKSNTASLLDTVMAYIRKILPF